MVEQNEMMQVLEKTPLFHGLRRRQLERLARRFVEREFEAGEVIVAQGQGGAGFFVVVTGEAEAVLERGDGSKTALNPLRANDFFGEMALLTDAVRSASVIAKTQVTCLVLTRWDFLSILKEDAEMAVAVLQELATRFSRVMSSL